MKRSLLIAAAAAVLLASVPAVANAAAPVPAKLTPPDVFLHPSDVPAALGKPKPGKSSYVVVEPGKTLGDNFELCVATSGQPAVWVTAAVGWMTTVKLAGPGSREISEWASTFNWPVGGEANFAEVQQAAPQCNGTTTTTIKNGVQVNANSSGTLPGNAVWISVDTKTKSKDPKLDGQVSTTYTVFRNALETIIQTRLYLEGTPTTTAKQRRAVNQLSLELLNNLSEPPS